MEAARKRISRPSPVCWSRATDSSNLLQQAHHGGSGLCVPCAETPGAQPMVGPVCSLSHGAREGPLRSRRAAAREEVATQLERGRQVAIGARA